MLARTSIRGTTMNLDTAAALPNLLSTMQLSNTTRLARAKARPIGMAKAKAKAKTLAPHLCGDHRRCQSVETGKVTSNCQIGRNETEHRGKTAPHHRHGLSHLSHPLSSKVPRGGRIRATTNGIIEKITPRSGSCTHRSRYRHAISCCTIEPLFPTSMYRICAYRLVI